MDFGEQGSGLHGSFLKSQAEFVARTVIKLASTCDFSEVSLVGHSFGGLVARAVPALHPGVRPLVKNIITLAAPLKTSPIMWERSVHEFYHSIESQSTRQPFLLSICGGIRDELIPPSLCNIDRPNVLAVPASLIIREKAGGPAPQFGMDHRAITWCHNLLSVIRSVIYELWELDESDVSIRMSSVQKKLNSIDSTTAESAVPPHHIDATQRFAIDLALIYNFDIIASLFTIAGVCHVALESTSLRATRNRWVALFLVTGIWLLKSRSEDFAGKTTWTGHYHGFAKVFILAVVACSGFSLVRTCLMIFRMSVGSWGHTAATVCAVATWFTVGVHLVFKLDPLTTSCTFISTVVSSVALAAWMAGMSQENLSIGTMYIVLTPMLAAGKIAVAASSLVLEGYIQVVLKLVAPVLGRLLVGNLVVYSRCSFAHIWCPGIIMVTLLCYIPSILTYGSGYHLSSLLSVVSSVDALRILLIYSQQSRRRRKES